MKDFLFTFLATSIIWIPCIIFFIVAGGGLKRQLCASFICLGFWLIMAIGLWGQDMGNEERWNNGYCTCGQHWELVSVTKSRTNSTTHKYYTCPNCYTEIEIIQ